MSASTQCPHSDIEYDIHTTIMADSNVASVRFKAVCKICGKKMILHRGCPMGASSRFPTKDSDESNSQGILIPMIAEDEEPTKEWGFTLTRSVVGAP